MRKGFTLVELSIVLVIIGLLIGGVLKGKGMIESTKMKRIKGDVDAIVAAAYTYQDSFNALPGDDSVARTINNVALAAGNGDGLFDGNAAAGESVEAWQAFIAMGLMSGDSAAVTELTIAKRNPFGELYLLRNAVFTGAVNMNVIQTEMPNNLIQMLDVKYDDGVQTTGDIRSSAAYTVTGNATLSWFAF